MVPQSKTGGFRKIAAFSWNPAAQGRQGSAGNALLQTQDAPFHENALKGAGAVSTERPAPGRRKRSKAHEPPGKFALILVDSRLDSLSHDLLFRLFRGQGLFAAHRAARAVTELTDFQLQFGDGA